jgi:hypothetical protein
VRFTDNRYITFFVNYSGQIIIAFFFFVGILTFDIYGVGWDEGMQRNTGLVNWNYIFNGDNTLLTYGDKDYGVAFELPLIFFEKIFHLQNEREIFLMRHLVTHLFFLLGAYFCLKLVSLLYENKLISMVGLLLYFLHPHLYAHSFFNSKDIPFMSLFMIGFYFMARLFKNQTTLNAILLGVVIGLLINIRIMGLLLLGSVLFFLLIDAFVQKQNYLNTVKRIGWLLGSTLITLYLSWPILWVNPHLKVEAMFKHVATYECILTNLFRGEVVNVAKLSWDYIPVWFSITTPIPFLLAGLCGILCVILLFIRMPLNYLGSLIGKSNLIFLSCFFTPVFAIMLMRPVLYDAWRHLFFIYAPFILLSVAGFNFFLKFNKKIAVIVTWLSFLFIGVFMLNNAPFQHVYFNYFITWNNEPEYIRKNYEMDYWGTSYKQSLEYILANDSSKEIRMCSQNYPGINNIKLLTPEQAARIRLVDSNQATYFLTNYRWHPSDYPNEYKSFYKIKVSNNTINEVFKLR